MANLVGIAITDGHHPQDYVPDCDPPLGVLAGHLELKFPFQALDQVSHHGIVNVEISLQFWILVVLNGEGGIHDRFTQSLNNHQDYLIMFQLFTTKHAEVSLPFGNPSSVQSQLLSEQD